MERSGCHAGIRDGARINADGCGRHGWAGQEEGVRGFRVLRVVRIQFLVDPSEQIHLRRGACPALPPNTRMTPYSPS